MAAATAIFNQHSPRPSSSPGSTGGAKPTNRPRRPVSDRKTWRQCSRNRTTSPALDARRNWPPASHRPSLSSTGHDKGRAFPCSQLGPGQRFEHRIRHVAVTIAITSEYALRRRLQRHQASTRSARLRNHDLLAGVHAFEKPRKPGLGFVNVHHGHNGPRIVLKDLVSQSPLHPPTRLKVGERTDVVPHARSLARGRSGSD